MNAPRHQFSTSAVVRVLAMLHRWFRDHAYSPSYREIEAITGVKLARICRYLDQLQVRGYLVHQHGVSRSIVMVDRFANASDDELERACHGRNWTVVKPPVTAIPLGEVYRLDKGVTDWGASLLDAIDEKVTFNGGVDRGQGQREGQNQADDPGEDRRAS